MTREKRRLGPETKESLAETLARLRPAIEGIRRAHGIGVEDGEDVLQETIVRFCRHPGSIECGEAWLRTAYRHECLRLLRRQRREAGARRGLAADGASGRRELTPSRELQVRELVAAIDRLPPREGQLLRGFYLEGLRRTELATLAGVALGSAKTLLARARGQLRRLLGTA